MNLFFFRIWKYLQYRWKAVGPHGLHSPFLFDLYYKVIKRSRRFRLSHVEEKRAELLKNHSLIDTFDLKSQKNLRKTISSIAKSSLSQAKFSAFLNLLIEYLNVKSALETGTSLGINALYMAGNDTIQKLVTIEASPGITALAKKQFSSLLQHKIQITEGTIQEVFEPSVIKEKPQLCFIDADHRSEAVLQCLEVIKRHNPEIKCIVIHDIYWSQDMFSAWKSIIADPSYNLTMDIFQAGVVFPNVQMPKQHFTVRF